MLFNVTRFRFRSDNFAYADNHVVLASHTDDAQRLRRWLRDSDVRGRNVIRSDGLVSGSLGDFGEAITVLERHTQPTPTKSYHWSSHTATQMLEHEPRTASTP